MLSILTGQGMYKTHKLLLVSRISIITSVNKKVYVKLIRLKNRRKQFGSSMLSMELFKSVKTSGVFH